MFVGDPVADRVPVGVPVLDGVEVGVPVMHTALRLAMHGEPVVGHTVQPVQELAPPVLNVEPPSHATQSALVAPPSV